MNKMGILAVKKNQLLVSNLNNKNNKHPKHPKHPPFLSKLRRLFLAPSVQQWLHRSLEAMKWQSFGSIFSICFSIQIYWNLLDIFCIWKLERHFRFGFSLWKKATMTCIDGDSAAILDRLVGSLQLSKVTKGKVRCEARVLAEKSLSCLQHQLHIGPGL